MSTAASQWLVRPRPVERPRGRVLCVPHAGGAPSAFARWAALFDPDIELCIASLPGRERRMREPPVRSIGPIVAGLAEALAELPPAPSVFFGHSFGSILAFELVRALRRGSQPLPKRLVVSACPSPDRVPVDQLAVGRSDEDLIALVASRFGGIPREVLDEPELVALVVAPMRADFELHDCYRCVDEPALPIPIDALGGADDGTVPRGALEDWARYTTDPLSLERFAGGHFYVYEHAAALARRFCAALIDEG